MHRDTKFTIKGLTDERLTGKKRKKIKGKRKERKRRVSYRARVLNSRDGRPFTRACNYRSNRARAVIFFATFPPTREVNNQRPEPARQASFFADRFMARCRPLSVISDARFKRAAPREVSDFFFPFFTRSRCLRCRRETRKKRRREGERRKKQRLIIISRWRDG